MIKKNRVEFVFGLLLAVGVIQARESYNKINDDSFSLKKFNQTPSKLQSAALSVLAKGSPADMQKLVQEGLDVNIPIGEYTLLMQTSDRKMIKCLIEECHADINEAVWQPRWRHYVTALDCSNWASFQSKEEAAIQAEVSAYLKSKGAKTAGELRFWSDYNGDYVLSSELESLISRDKSHKIPSPSDNKKKVQWIDLPPASKWYSEWDEDVAGTSFKFFDSKESF